MPGSGTTQPPASKLVRPPDELRRLLLLLLGLMMALIIGATAIIPRYLHDRAIQAAEVNTAGVARLLDQHISRTLGATGAVLRRMVKVSQARLRGKITSAEELQELLVLQDGLPEPGSILVVDATGRVVTASTPPQNEAPSMADRPWFQAHKDGKEMVVGPMVHGRYSRELIFTVSQRLSDEQGQFAGAVVSGVDAAFFTDFYNSRVVGRNGYVAADTAGKVMLRQPYPERYAGVSVAGGKVVKAAAIEPAGTLRTVSPLDGIERIVSYRTLAGFDVVVSTGVAVDEVLESWTQTTLILVGALAATGLGLLGLALMAFRSIAREEASMLGLEQTVRERTEEAESRAEEARLANDSKTRFLAAASHDLRQPLQAAGMFAEVLSSRIDDERSMVVVDKLRQSIEATNSLLTTLLDVSALEAGKIKPNPTRFRLMPLLVGLVDQIEPEASRRGLSIGAVPTKVEVTTDAILLERLLRNLLINAVRYTEKGGILIGCRYRGGKVAIQVWDTGIGIAPDKTRSVFEDFVRIEGPEDRRSGHGLGLGLGVVRRMAALLGHPLELHSTPGKGSCFGVVVDRG